MDRVKTKRMVAIHWKVLVSVAFVIMLVAAYYLSPFGIHDINKSYYSSRNPTYYYNLYSLFFWNWGSVIENIILTADIAASGLGLLFIWLNRPEWSLSVCGVWLLTMIASLVRNYNSVYYHLSGRNEIVIVDPVPYIVLWFVFLALVSLAFLALWDTRKHGARRPQTQRYVNRPQQTATASTQSGNEEAMEILRQLADLRARGILTDEEFNRKKSELLGSITLPHAAQRDPVRNGYAVPNRMAERDDDLPDL